MRNKPEATPRQAAEWLTGGGEMGMLIRELDWSRTPLGPLEKWPQSLRTAVSLCLASNFPINIVWGPEHTQIYNDSYRVCCGDAHPRALGENYRVTWASAWPTIGESFERALAGETMYLENQRMFLNRLGGALEETFFTFSHSPVRDESGGVGGLFHPVTETTATMLSERRTRALRDLSASLGLAEDEAEVARRAVDVLSRYDFDLPFLLCYRLEPKGGSYRLAAHHGIAAGLPAAPVVVASTARTPWPLAEALTTGQIVEVCDLSSLLQGESCGPYPESPNRAFVIPVIVPAAERPPMALVVGASSRLPMNEAYRSFYQLISVTVSNALSTVRAREDERRRAEALAGIDRAKTAFFSNVSHEFRTPLTLMLGPLEDTLAEAGLPPAARERLEVAHRNSQRLLKLVNTLLDFSRIEAGRIEAVYEPTDLAAFTADLASVFRSAIERAGMKLVIDCPPLPAAVCVDHDMWEKIVLNLLSNAFKFTFAGEIRVTLRQAGEMVELVVSDTGTGIPAEELPHLFERFHRVRGAKGRSYEGSGIGLALVQELVRLHGGSVRVTSEVDRGSAFIVSIPVGKAHLPADRIGAARKLASTSLRGEAYVEEALRWLPESSGQQSAFSGQLPQTTNNGQRTTNNARILLADDNADMRDYVRRLLSESGYEVVAVADGEAALAAARAQVFDLALADVMMPRLDGFGLLRALRTEERTQTMPVILLSARAGEESRVEGLTAGADDYLMKPFSARELLARVEGHLQLQRVRRVAQAALRESEAMLSAVLRQLPVGLGVMDASGRWMISNEIMEEFVPQAIPSTLPERLKRWRAYEADGTPIPPENWPGARALRGEVVAGLEMIHTAEDGRERWMRVSTAPLRAPSGEIIGATCVVADIDRAKRAEEQLRESEGRYRGIVNQTVGGIAETDLTGAFTIVNDRYCEITGYTREELLGGMRMQQITHPDDLPRNLELFQKCLSDGTPFEIEKRYVRKDGAEVWVYNSVSVIAGADGRPKSLVAVSLDITARKRAEHKLADSEAHFRAFVTASTNVVYRMSPDWREMRHLEGRDFIADTAGPSATWLEKYIHPDDQPHVLATINEAIRTKSMFALEHRVIRVDGTLGWTFSRAIPLLDDEGEIVEWFGAASDVTERKQAEAALRESEARHRQLLSLLPVAVYTIKAPTGEITYYNEQATALWGRAPIIGDTEERFCGSLRLWLPDGSPLPHDRTPMVNTLTDGQSFRNLNVLIERPDGSRITVLVNIDPLLDESGHVVGAINVFHDITALIEAQQALRKSERENREILESITDAFLALDADWRFTYTNRQMEEMLGRAPGELLGRVIWDEYPGLVGSKFEQAYRRAATEGVASTLTDYYPDHDRWYEVHVYPRLSAGGGIAVYFQNVTERKRQEAALRESRARLEATQANAPIGIVETSLDGTYLSVNDEFCRIVGYTRDELLGKNITDLTWAEDYPRNHELFEQLTTGRVPSFRLEKRFVRKDGSLVWADVHRTLVKDADGKPLYVVGAIVDISERRRAAEVSARLAAIVSSSADAIISKTLDGRITSWNAGAEAIFGYTAEEITGQPITRLFPPELVAEEEHILTRIRRGENIKHYETVRVTKDGRRLDVSLTISPIKDGTGKIIGASKILRDVTERKQAEAERERLLQSEQEARAEAEAATRAKDEFLTVVSHELRNPLNSILGYTRLIHAHPQDAVQVRQYAEIIIRSAKMQQQLIEDLLDTARIMTGKLKIEAAPADLLLVLREALSVVQPATEAKQIELTAQLGDEPVMVIGDATRLQQIAWNLLQNAIKFTPEGGRVELRLEHDNTQARIVISDTGRGIEPEFLPHLFERFSQRDMSRTRRYGGLGLGLALVRELVELHGGTVEAASAGAGTGATFTVTLPRRAPQTVIPRLQVCAVAEVRTGPEAILLANLPRLDGVRVLVVDDQKEARHLVAEALSGQGAAVSTAASGQEAVTQMNQQRFDVLVCDISMPDEDGYAVLRRIRDLEARQGIPSAVRLPAIALTALNRTEDRLAALRAGFRTYLAKPVEPAELITIIAGIVPGRQREAKS
ncbi:MAG: PAS domain S-box protein [Blastocatellia bacterium]